MTTMDMLRKRAHDKYSKEMEEAWDFMRELDARRKRRHLSLMAKTREMIGPIWYQELSPKQRATLKRLSGAIKQDVLEDRASRVHTVITELGVYPVPPMTELMTCIMFARKKPIEFLSEVFKLLYNHPVHVKRESYPINARFLLSAVCYLGMEEVIELLTGIFYTKPESPRPPLEPKKKKVTKYPSPYLRRMIAKGPDELPPKEKKVMPPLPSVTDLMNVPYEEEMTLSKPPPPPLPPPPPKKRIPIQMCDQIAGIGLSPIENVPQTLLVKKSSEARIAKSKVSRHKESKLSYGTASGKRKIRKRRRITLIPTPYPNAHYTIGGVAIVNGKPLYIINGIAIDHGDTNMINNGIVILNGIPITIVGGLVATNPPTKTDPCDCMKWHDRVMKYAMDSKCRCGHLYDFYNEGSTKPSDPVYFKPPTTHHPYTFDYNKIYDLDEKRLFVDSVMNELVYQDSVIGIPKTNPDQQKNEKPAKLKKAPSRQSKCLSDNPTPAEYLKCTLKSVRRLSVLASLPDAQLVPELLEWMRHRIFGDISPKTKARYLYRSKIYWDFYHSLNIKHWGHVGVPKLPYDSEMASHMTWGNKKWLIREFADVQKTFRRRFFLSAANQYNLLWPTMFQDIEPDKSFRQVFFAYIGSRQEQYHVYHPYNTKEVMERKRLMENGRISCLETFVSQKMD